MLVIILALLLILGIAFFQAIQGIFSSLIMAVLTVLSAVIAFNFYELLAAALYDTQPAYADAIALVALFVLPLLALRLTTDYLVRGNVVLGSDMASVWIERGAAGILGLFTAEVLVGVLMVAVQMLPFGSRVMGYSPFDPSLRRDQALAPFYPDRFALGLVEMLSDGALSSDRSYREAHDNLLLETFCGRNQAGWGGRTEAPPDSLKVVAVHEFDPRRFDPGVRWPSWKLIENHPIFGDSRYDGSDPSSRLIRITMAVNILARDEDGAMRLPGTHFRLVSKSGKSYYPIAGAITNVLDSDGRPALTLVRPGGMDPQEGQLYQDLLERFVQPAEPYEDRWNLTNLALYMRIPTSRNIEEYGNKSFGKIEYLTIEWIYHLDAGETPDSVVFRRMAKAPIPAAPAQEG